MDNFNSAMSNKQRRNQHRIERLQQRTESRGKAYFWAYAIYNGKLVILGAYNSEQEAQRIAFSRIQADFRIVQLPTKDQNRATQLVKYKVLNSTEDLDFSMQRAKHKGF